MTTLPKKQPAKIIEGDRIILRARSVDQAAESFALVDRNRDHLKPWMPWEETTKSVENSKSYIELAMGWWENQSTFDFSMYEKLSNKMIGSFGFHSINWDKKSCALGYWIDEKHQGHGFVSEAVKIGEKVALELGFHRIIVTCDRLNHRSQKIPRRLGYKLESTQIDECIYRGRLRDTLQFVKLINQPIEGRITENLPAGFSIKDCEADEFLTAVDGQFERIFDDNELILRVRDILTDFERSKLKVLNENFKHPYLHHALVLYNDNLAGWTWGYQDSRESFYMVNSAILPEFRGRGLYSRLLDVTLEKLINKGFQRIWSRHNITNNAIIIPKLKRGFHITGTELSDAFGSLIHVTYFTNKTRKKALDFRAGHLRPDEELKQILKI